MKRLPLILSVALVVVMLWLILIPLTVIYLLGGNRPFFYIGEAFDNIVFPKNDKTK